jgi:hypothetical protein
MKIPSLLGGLAGALTLTALDEAIKRIDHSSPHPNLLGRNAVARIVKGTGLSSLAAQGQLKPMAATGELITNSLYFGMAEAGSPAKTLARGTLLGFAAGLGALTLSKPLGLDARESEVSATTKTLTVAWYVAGGLVAAAVMNLITKREQV